MKVPLHSLFAALTSSRLCLVVPIGALALLGGPSAQAATVTWDGTGSGANGKNWLNPDAWAGGILPGTLDTANFGILTYGDAPYQPSVQGPTGNAAGSAIVAGLTFNNTNKTILTIPTGSTLTISGTTSVNQTADIVNAAGTFNTTNLSLDVGKTLTISSPISIAGTLSGAGTITGATVTVNGTHSPGGSGSVATQSVTNITYGAGSIFEWDLNATTADPGVNAVNSGTYDKVTGSGSGSGIFKIVLGTNVFTDAFWNTNKTWTDIFSGSDPTFATFLGTGVATDGKVAGQGQFSYSGGSLSWTAVPEPTSALAALLLGAGLLRRRRDALV